MYHVKQDMTYTSDWVIYLASCTIHKKQYVGKSKYNLNTHMNTNRSHIKTNYNSCRLVDHFLNSNNCNMEDNLILIPIERIRISDGPQRTTEDKERALKNRERFWQKELSTIVPFGLNKREER